MVWKIDDPAGNESGKIVWELPQYTRGRGLDLGCGPNKAYPHFIGVDGRQDSELFGIQMTPDITADCTKLDVFGSASMDFVYSSHLLEHIEDYRAALKEWWRVIKPGGHLVLYLPHKDFYPNIGQHGANPDHKHDFAPQDIVTSMRQVGSWELLRNDERNGGREYSFFQVYKKRTDGKNIISSNNPAPEKSVALVRYGAFGDLIQLSSVLPDLKRQGYHITLYTVPKGFDVVRHDPHIDAVYLQDPDQIPNHRLPEFWANEAKKFDKFVNLSESVEGTLLALPGRIAHQWPDELRHSMMNRNYIEFTHALAGAELPCRSHFYATEDEKAWARKEAQKIGGELYIYSLAGSSVHKVWPYMDGLIARILLTNKNARILLVGDDASKILEQGWENEPRVICKSGKYTIRESMAMLAECKMVIGTETGMLNAASMMPMRKVCFLSHSSRENLTKHWVNTIAVEPEHTHCYPCHKMHYGFDHCNRHEETGTALCQANISLDSAWQAMTFELKAAA